MAYVRVLAIVLCACFIQDAFSVSANGRRVQATNNAAAPQATQSRSPARRTTTVRHTVSRRAAAVEPQPEPVKYPHLKAVTDMFWDTCEDLNRTNDSGKLSTRAARNAASDVLSSGQFWSSLVSEMRRKVKVTNDKQKADSRVRLCNDLASTITSPMAVEGFRDVANDVYGTVSNLHTEVGTDALQLATDMVNNGEVVRGLDALTNIVTHVRLNPLKLVKCFEMLRKTLNLGGSMNMGGGLAKGLMSLSSKLNK